MSSSAPLPVKRRSVGRTPPCSSAPTSKDLLKQQHGRFSDTQTAKIRLATHPRACGCAHQPAAKGGVQVQQMVNGWLSNMLTCGSSQSPVSSQSSALITTRVQTSASMPCMVGVAKSTLQGCRAQHMRPHLHAAYDTAAHLIHLVCTKRRFYQNAQKNTH